MNNSAYNCPDYNWSDSNDMCNGSLFRRDGVMENFFGHLKSELLYLQSFDSIDNFKTEIIDYLNYYNNTRIKVKIKGLPPAIHRQQALKVA